MKRRAPLIILVAILLLAAALRFYRLDAQSFWNDEGNSARIAERTLDLIVEGAAGDIHPPGYYLLLHLWRALFGQSEFALRSLSVAAGLVLVAFTYLLGRHLFAEAVGLTAAFLGAISPFAIYYSQEARMYAVLGALSVASIYFAIRALLAADRPSPTASRGWLVAYVLTSGAGLYTQYAFALILLVHSTIFGLWWLTAARRCVARWRWLAVWVAAQIAIAALYLPWLKTALRSVTGWSSAGRAYELGPALADVLRVLSVGLTLPLGAATAALITTGGLLVVGLVPRRAEPRSRFGVASLALYLLLPVALIFAFDLYKPAWLKFLVVVLLPFHVLLSHGVGNLARLVDGERRAEAGGHWPPNLQSLVSTIAIALAIAVTVPSLHNLYFDPTYFRDDYRQIAADIAARARPGGAAHPADAVILNAPNQWEVFTYYYPDEAVYPAPYRPHSGAVEPFLSPLIERYRRLFVLFWGDAESDPRGLVEAWLAANAYKAGDRWYGSVRVATYGAGPLPEEPAVVLDARFGEAIRLHGYALGEAGFAPGDILPVTLFWEAEDTITERHKVTVQALDGAGQLVAQVDAEPCAGLAPTDAWQPGQAVTDRYGVLLPPDLPPGRYTLVVALYDAISGRRLPATRGGEPVGDHLALSDIEVLPAR